MTSGGCRRREARSEGRRQIPSVETIFWELESFNDLAGAFTDTFASGGQSAENRRGASACSAEMFAPPRASGGTLNSSLSSSRGPSRGDETGDDTLQSSQGNNNGTTVGTSRRKSSSESRTLRVNLSACKYESIRLLTKRLGFDEVDEEYEHWDLNWTDLSVTEHRVSKMFPFQRINHFPGMMEICRKASLSRHLKKMQKSNTAGENNQYCFAPATWEYPNEFESFRKYCKAHPGQSYIVKPTAGAMGKGIYLIKHPDQIDERNNRVDEGGAPVNNSTNHHTYVIQKYISNPFLLDGYKFDLRIYALVTSVDPLTIYVYDEGIVRVATLPYQPPSSKNLSQKTMHLTNYSLNKHSGTFHNTEAEDSGTKRSLSSLWKELWLKGHDTDALSTEISDLIVKTILPIQPQLAHTYHAAVTALDEGKKKKESRVSRGNDAGAYVTGIFSQQDNGGSINSGNRVTSTGSYAAQFASSTVVGSYEGSGTVQTGRASSAGTRVPNLHNDATSRCFEILGFDVLLDDTLKPSLIEVNHSPSFGTDSALDKKIKEGLLGDTINNLRIDPGDRIKWLTKEKEKQKVRLYETIKGSNASRQSVALSKAPNGNKKPVDDELCVRPSGAEPGSRRDRVKETSLEIVSLRAQLAAFGADDSDEDESEGSGDTSPRANTVNKFIKAGGMNKLDPPEKLGSFRRAHPPIGGDEKTLRKKQNLQTLSDTAETFWTPVAGCACSSCDGQNIKQELSYAVSRFKKVTVEGDAAPLDDRGDEFLSSFPFSRESPMEFSVGSERLSENLKGKGKGKLTGDTDQTETKRTYTPLAGKANMYSRERKENHGSYASQYLAKTNR